MPERNKKVLENYRLFLEDAEKTLGRKINPTTGGKSSNHIVSKRKSKTGKGALDLGRNDSGLKTDKEKRKIARLALRHGLNVGFEGHHLHIDDNMESKKRTFSMKREGNKQLSKSKRLEKQVIEDHKREVGARGEMLFGAPREEEPTPNTGASLVSPTQDINEVSNINIRLDQQGNTMSREDDALKRKQEEAKGKEVDNLEAKVTEVIKQDPEAVKQQFKQMNVIEPELLKEVDDDINRIATDQPRDQGAASGFKKALSFFLPQIIGGLAGGAIGGGEGAIAGIEESGKARDAFLSHELARDKLAKQGTTSSFQDRSLQIREQELAQRKLEFDKIKKPGEVRRGKQLELNVKKFGLSEKSIGQLSDGQVKQLQDINAIEGDIARIEELREEVNTGPLAGRIQSMAQWADLSPESFNRMKARTASTLSNYVKSISGAQVTEAEALRLEAVIPHVNDAPDVFESKVKEFSDIVNNNKKAFAKAIQTGQPLKMGAIKGLLKAETKFMTDRQKRIKELRERLGK